MVGVSVDSGALVKFAPKLFDKIPKRAYDRVLLYWQFAEMIDVIGQIMLFCLMECFYLICYIFISIMVSGCVIDVWTWLSAYNLIASY